MSISRPPLLGLLAALALPVSLLALPERAQLHVELTYTRTANLKTVLGPDNHEVTSLNFTLTSKFDTLADVIPPDDNAKWPGYAFVPSQTEIHTAASLQAYTQVDRGPGDRPARTTHSYSGTTARIEDLTVKSAYPVTPDALIADLTLRVEMSGTSTGVPGGLSANASVSALSYSPLTESGGNEPLHCNAKFILLPIAGPRPKPDGPLGETIARAYDLTHALSWGGATVPSQGAPSQNWIGAKTTKGPDGLPALTLKETKTWTDANGEATDTLTVLITSVPMTLKAAELPPAMDENAVATYVKDIVANAKKILGSTKDAAKAYTIVLAHLEQKFPDLSPGDREWIASEAITALLEKKILKESNADE